MKLNGDYLEDMAQLEQCECYDWGENLLRVIDEDGDGYLVNKVTGKARLIDSHGLLIGFPDKEIDFETLDKIPHSHNAHSRRIDYARIGRWDNCENGLIALSWMLYPDGLDEDLNVVRPFTVVRDVRALLNELRQDKA